MESAYKSKNIELFKFQKKTFLFQPLAKQIFFSELQNYFCSILHHSKPAEFRLAEITKPEKHLNFTFDKEEIYQKENSCANNVSLTCL